MSSSFKYRRRDAKNIAAATRHQNDAPGGSLGAEPRGTVPMSSKSVTEHKSSERSGSVAVDRPRQFWELSEAERHVWVSVEEGGLTPTEIAERPFFDEDGNPLDVGEEWSPSTVRTLLKRARDKMEGDR